MYEHNIVRICNIIWKYKFLHSQYYRINIIDTYRPSDNELILECRVRGNPAPVISWLKDGCILRGDRYKQSYLDDDIYRLEIAAPKSTDNGRYTCRAMNDLRTEEISHVVQFNGIPIKHLWVNLLYLKKIIQKRVFFKNEIDESWVNTRNCSTITSALKLTKGQSSPVIWATTVFPLAAPLPSKLRSKVLINQLINQVKFMKFLEKNN